jgi:hypothetical protein
VICKHLSTFLLPIYYLAFRLAFFLCDFIPEFTLESCCRHIRTTYPANCNPLTRLYNTRSVYFYTWAASPQYHGIEYGNFISCYERSKNIKPGVWWNLNTGEYSTRQNNTWPFVLFCI